MLLPLPHLYPISCRFYFPSIHCLAALPIPTSWPLLYIFIYIRPNYPTPTYSLIYERLAGRCHISTPPSLSLTFPSAHSLHTRHHCVSADDSPFPFHFIFFISFPPFLCMSAGLFFLCPCKKTPRRSLDRLMKRIYDEISLFLFLFVVG
ncbi:uncharacterized protein GGS25DRAFT_467877 [Hypoxylon fragiforme]|uniref:uncharacterized protein n=1 Tax=Hypoxylon fragiforme TaxID=63214 RepID=UPI0020C644D4|nr:uncharacterized protein GGS25DRAFT_467877 [Hypoxylon fragiforme]KAI2613596.1 hypothetical protein GGS25DRAFT_467877 [Hypoxylon fragiforme]